MTTPDTETLPWPGEELAHRVSANTDKDYFFKSGQESVKDLQRSLGVIGTDLASYDSILDFGCGCGRILVWLKDLTPKTSLFGSDIDERAINWADENIGWASFGVNGELPPLSYADGQFDLVFANSVFTHVDELHQDRWLDELRRVTRPGGHLLLSVHGEHVMSIFDAQPNQETRNASLRRSLNESGIAFIKDDAFVGSPFPDSYHSTLHAPWYIFERWGKVFKILAYISQGMLGFQDFVLLERLGEDAAPKPLSKVLGNGGDSLRGRTAGGSTPASERPLIDEFRRFVRKVVGPAQNPSPQSTDHLVEAIRLQGDRINRLENDLWEALKALGSAGANSTAKPPKKP